MSIKKDNLWVHSINNVYIKDKSIENTQIPKQASWIIRNILEAQKWLSNVNMVDDIESIYIKGCSVSSKRTSYSYHDS